jgi:hypothetical protein
MNSQAQVKGLTWWTQGHTFVDDMRILDIGAYDAILGVNWLKQFGKTTTDWVDKTISFSYQGKSIVLQGDQIIQQLNYMNCLWNSYTNGWLAIKCGLWQWWILQHLVQLLILLICHLICKLCYLNFRMSLMNPSNYDLREHWIMQFLSLRILTL